MKKYFAFAKYSLKTDLSVPVAYISTFISYVIHILILNQLFEFIFANKITDGFSHQDLVWYVIIGEVFMYSFHNGFRTIARDITNGNIAYNLSKPYNFMLRIISEQLASLPKTLMLFGIGSIIGTIIVGPIHITLSQFALFFIIFIVSEIIQLLLHLIVGISALWIGQDVSSIWLIVNKFMLILVFTPLDFLPKPIQIALKILPTTHVTYTPSQLFVHFSYANFYQSLAYTFGTLIVLTTICTVLYLKGVKKINVNGI